MSAAGPASVDFVPPTSGRQLASCLQHDYNKTVWLLSRFLPDAPEAPVNSVCTRLLQLKPAQEWTDAELITALRAELPFRTSTSTSTAAQGAHKPAETAAVTPTPSSPSAPGASPSSTSESGWMRRADRRGEHIVSVLGNDARRNIQRYCDFGGALLTAAKQERKYCVVGFQMMSHMRHVSSCARCRWRWSWQSQHR
jgi:hypothetical protein